MALTIAIEGKGVIANADLETNDTGGTGTGDWFELGGGTIAESGVSIQAGNALAGGYSNKDGWQYFDIGATNELDFTPTTGTEEGQHIYLWVQMPALAQLDTLANNGLRCRIGSSTTDYREWTFASNDDSNGWLGGWKCFVIDPTKAGTVTDTGTFDIASVRMYGFYINTSSAGRGDNFFADRIVVAKGLRITGTSTTGWQDLVDYCIASTNALGMIQEREGIIYAMGNIWIGDATSQTADVSFADTGKVIKFATCEYYSGSAWVSSMASTNAGIIIEDHTSYKTTFTDGILVGTDNGRSGSTIIGNDNETVFIDLHGGNHADSATLLYGTKFQNISGLINLGNDIGHKVYGCSFIQSAQFDPVGAPAIRNCVFAETSAADAALLWNSNIDIQNCTFIANTDVTNNPAGIEHATTDSDSGTVTTADALGITLTDSAATFTTWGVAADDVVYNQTDDSWAKVVSVTSQTELITDGLTGGTDDQFASSDVYDIAYPITYTDLTFTGNDFDVYNSTTKAVAISKSGTSNPIDYNTAGEWMTFIGSVLLKVTVVDAATDPIQDAQTAVYLASDGTTELLNADTNASGIATTSYAGSTPVDVIIRIRKNSPTDDPRYVNKTVPAVILASTGLDTTVSIDIDTVAGTG